MFLPTDIIKRFTITKVESDNSDIRIYLDEIADDTLVANPDIESKGFTEPSTVRDFPIRDKGVDLIARRRRWHCRSTNSSFSVPFEGLKAEGVRYSKEFAAFLKEVYGDQTYDLPFA